MALKELIQRKPLSDRFEDAGWYDESKATTLATAKETFGLLEKKLIVSDSNQLIIKTFRHCPVNTLEGVEQLENHAKVGYWDAAKFIIHNELDLAESDIPAPLYQPLTETLELMRK
jgi:hypothetical protein